MKPFLSFVKMQLNVNYGISALKYRFTREKKKLWEPILIAVAILVSLLPMLALYTMLMSGIFTAGMAIGQPEIVLVIAFLFAMFIIMFFGIFYIMGTFYFSKDMESLVPLPLKPYEVVGGKFAVIMVNEYLTAVPLLLPPLIIYGAGTGQGVLYWLKSIVLMLAVPSMPLTAAALLIMIMMRFINFRKLKDLLAIIGGLAAIVIGMGFSMVFQYMPENPNPEYFNNLIASRSGLIELIGSRFPPSIWATKGLSEAGLAGIGYFLLFVAVCALLFLMLLWLSDKVFYKALLAGQEVSRKKKMLTEIQKTKQYGKVSRPVLSLMQREWRLLYRTPIYVLNGLIGSIVGPLIILIMFSVKGSDNDAIQLFEVINKPEAAPYVLLGGLGIMLFTAGMNIVASTTLSREGNTFWVTKMIPVSAKQQVASKFLVSYFISAFGVAVTGIIMWLFMNQPLIWVIGAAAVGLLGAVPMVALSLLLDVFHPKLVWNSEQEAMKQNINGGIGLLLSLLVLAVLGLSTYVLVILRQPMWFIFIALGAVSVMLGILSVLALFEVAERKYRELEA